MSPRLASAAVLALALSMSGRALALGAVISSPPGASSIVSLRTAISSAGGRMVRWGSIEVRGTASTVAWIIPARPGAALDLASDAWLEALEAASAPRVVPPDVTPPCGIPGGVEVEGDFTHAATAAPGAVSVAPDRPSLDAVLGGHGLSLTSDLAPAIDAAFEAGDAVVALVYTDAPGDLVTRTVRVVDTSPPSFPFALVEAGAVPISITAFAIGDGSVAVGDQPPMIMNASAVVWRDDGTSSYPTVRDGLLAANPGAWLFETGGHAMVFDGTTVPGGTPTPPLTTSYFFRASSYADATGAPDSCTGDAAAIAQSDAMVAAACPAGSLARIGTGAAPCQEIVGAGELDPSALRCGGIADDLSLALSGLEPAQTWITRVRGSLAPWTSGGDTGVSAASAAGPYGPVVTASTYAQACTGAPGTTGTPASGGSGQAAGGSGGGGTGPQAGGAAADPGGNGGAVVAGVAAASNIASTASDPGGGCGGDTSDSEDSSGSCDGSSSSSSDDSSGCDESAADGSDSSCDVTHHRRGDASRTALLLVALATVERRRRRPRTHEVCR